MSTTTKGPRTVTIANITANGDTDYFFLEGSYSVMIYGTFDTASVDLETRISHTSDVKDVGVAALLSVTSDTGWVALDAGSGDYRLEVAGGGASLDITLACRRYAP